MLLLAGAQILCGDIDDTVGIDIKGNLDLWDSPHGWWYAVQVKSSDGAVLCGHWALALEYVNLDRWLIIRSRGKNFGLLCRDSGIGFDELGKYAAQGFNTHGEWGDIEQQNIFHFTAQNTALDSCSDSYHLIRIYAFRWYTAKEIFNNFLDSRNPGGSSYQDNFINLGGGDAGIFKSFAAGLYGRLDQFIVKLFELRAGEGFYQVFRYPVHRHDVGQVDFGGGR